MEIKEIQANKVERWTIGVTNYLQPQMIEVRITRRKKKDDEWRV